MRTKNRKISVPNFSCLEMLWDVANPSEAVHAYFSAHAGEFDTKLIESAYPYSGPASRYFVRSTENDPRPHLERFATVGPSGWLVRKETLLNGLAADLCAGAELLGKQLQSSAISGPPGGFGADTCCLWIPLLDGGLGVDVQIYEDEWTNRVSGRQRTVIRGPRAYRVLLHVLGFGWINRRLEGESGMPEQTEIRNLGGRHFEPSKTWLDQSETCACQW